MKNKLHFLVIALFMTVIFIPLFYTPFLYEKERLLLTHAETRDPRGTLSFSECDESVETWVGEAQLWYQESFAFRSVLLRLYNTAHYLLRNYPEEIYGREGHLFRRRTIFKKLASISPDQSRRIRRKLNALHAVTQEADIPCLFIIIPAKETIHPERLPRWLRVWNLGQRRQDINDLIRQEGFPLVDLSETLKKYVEKSDEVLYRKYDNHWNMQGALLGYREIIFALLEFLPETRFVLETQYTLFQEKSSTQDSRHLYLDFLLREDLIRMQHIDLPSVRVLSAGGEKQTVFYRATRKDQSEVFCPNVKTGTVVFIRDSFLDTPSVLLNHSFNHTVYLNYSKEGRCPADVIQLYQPDVLVFALQENALFSCLQRLEDKVSQ